MSLVKRQYDEFVFGLKYRPETIDDAVMPPRFKKMFNRMVETKDIGNLILSGQQGCGKTTAAFCLADQTGLDHYYMRMSKDTSIDNIRTTVMDFISSVSFEDGKKIFIGDEFERLSPQAMDSLKTEIEIYSKNVNFIFITNHKHKVDKILLSRLDEIDFVFSREERIQMKKDLMKRLMIILKTENIKWENEALVKIINMHFPDMRKILNFVNLVQKQNEGAITVSFIERSMVSQADLNAYYKSVSSKDYGAARNLISGLPVDLTTFYSTLFNTMVDYIEPDSIPQAVLILDEFQHKSVTSPDPQIPLSACTVHLMTDCEWR